MNSSLKNKISANDEKLHKLFDKNKKTKSKVGQNIDNKENQSYIENKQKEGKHDISIITDNISNKEVTSISINSKNNIKTNQIKKKRTTLNNQKKYNNNYFDLYNHQRNLENNQLLKVYNKTITLKNNYRKNLKSKKEKLNNIIIKKDNKNKILSPDKNNINKILSPHKTNININNNNKKRNNNKNKNHIIDISHLDILNNSLKSSGNISNMLERFDENQRKKKEKIEKLKKLKEDKEKIENTYKPQISKKSKSINKKIKDDFLTRQKNYIEIKNKKEKKLKEYILKNEKEKINKNNILLHRKSKEYATARDNLNTSFISDISCCTRSMIEIDHNISKLFEWENKRKEKIIKKQKEKNKELEKNKHIPHINRRSNSMVNKRKNKKENIFERLSKVDDIVIAKKKILEELYRPSFQPNFKINLNFIRFFDENIKEEINKKNKRNSIDNNCKKNSINIYYSKRNINNFSKRSSIDYSKKNNIYYSQRNSIDYSKRNIYDNNEFTERIIVNRNHKIKPKNIKNDEDIQKENEKIENEKVYNDFRKMIINNMNKKVRNKSLDNYE